MVSNGVNFGGEGNVIKADKAGIDAIGNTVNEESGEIDNIIKGVNTDLENVSSAWVSFGGKNYLDAMKGSYMSSLAELKECIDSHNEFLKKVYDEYKSVDDTYSSKIKGIDL